MTTPNRTRTPPPSARFIDNTIMEGWQKCSLAGWLTYHIGQDGESRGSGWMTGTPRASSGDLAKGLGSAVHAAVANWELHRDLVNTLATFDARYRPLVATPPEDTRYTLENTRDLLAAWCYRNQSDQSTRFQPLAHWVEHYITVPLIPEENIWYVSRPDALGTWGSQTGHYSREFKTTRSYLSDDWGKQWEKSSQLTGQIWAIAEFTGDIPRGAIVEAIRVLELPSGPDRCRTHKRPKSECRLAHADSRTYGPYIRSPQAIATWKRIAQQIAREFFASTRYTLDQLDEIPERGSFNAWSSCGFCAHAHWCANGKEPLAFQHAPLIWDPIQGKKVPRTQPQGA